MSEIPPASWQAVLIALITNSPQILTSIAAVIGAFYAMRSAAIARVVDKNLAVAAEKVESVAKSVDGAANVSVSKIEALQQELTRMTAEIASLNQVAALSAQAAVIANAPKLEPYSRT